MVEAAKAKTTRKKVTTKAKSKSKATAKKTTGKKLEVVGASKEPVGMIDAQKLRDQARVAYTQFQKSWYSFAKVVSEIHDNDVWTNLGHENFKEYCKEEFKDIGYPTIIKFIQVVKSWGPAIESKLEKDPNSLLPSYETCYTLTASEQKFPKAEVPKLRKQVLDGKVTVRDMRERVAEFKEEKEQKETSDAEKKLAKDLESAAPLSVKLADGDGIDEACEIVIGKVNFLNENLPLITKNVKEPSEKLVELARQFENLFEIGEAFLDKIEEISEKE